MPTAPCALCERPVARNGLCWTHYRHRQAALPPAEIQFRGGRGSPKYNGRTCRMDGCSNPCTGRHARCWSCINAERPERGQPYRTALARVKALSADARILDNARLVAADYREAIESASAELLALIQEQDRDRRAWSVNPDVPYRAPVVPLNDETRYDARRTYEEVLSYEGNGPWDDPTYDSAVALIEAEREKIDLLVYDWNAEHRLPRVKHIDTTDYRLSPTEQAGVRHRIRSRRKRRRERIASASGGRPSRKTRSMA